MEVGPTTHYVMGGVLVNCCGRLRLRATRRCRPCPASIAAGEMRGEGLHGSPTGNGGLIRPFVDLQ